MIPRRTLGVAVIAVLPLVAACGAGRDTTTDKERQTPYVASASAGPLLVTAARLVPSQAATSSATPAADTGTPTPSASGSAGGAPSAEAYLVVTVYNSGGQPDQLTGAQVQGASVTPRDQSASALTVDPRKALQFVDPEVEGNGPVLEVSGFAQPIQDGTALPVTFQFQNAGSVTLQVPVRSGDSLGTTSTSTPLPLTGSYPSATETPEGLPSGG